MKTIFCTSVLISGSITFAGVYACRKHEQKKFDRKMNLVSDWLNRPR